MKIERYLKSQMANDLKEKMLFLGGPRQVGKTFLSKEFINNESQYLNWDRISDKSILLKDQLDIKLKLIILDEIHKYRMWRNLIKGYFDKYFPKLNFIVTGSARLDHFRKGGDSLVGRYHYLRLHPLSLNEVSDNPKIKDLENLLNFGGFPEPFIKKNKVHHSRWINERTSRVVSQDLKDLETVKDTSLIELLAYSLPKKVGGPLSIKSLHEDLSVSPNTVSRWIEILEQLYFCYRIYPYGSNKLKAVKKTAKLYMWDWSMVEDAGARFENLVASQLLKYCHFNEDCLGKKMELRYFKNVVNEKEIDFIVLEKGKPLFAVECKTGEKQLSKELVSSGKKLNIPRLYQVHMGTKQYGTEQTGMVLPFIEFCKLLEMP